MANGGRPFLKLRFPDYSSIIGRFGHLFCQRKKVTPGSRPLGKFYRPLFFRIRDPVVENTCVTHDSETKIDRWFLLQNILPRMCEGSRIKSALFNKSTTFLVDQAT